MRGGFATLTLQDYQQSIAHQKMRQQPTQCCEEAEHKKKLLQQET
jgi:hypothetical protein